MLNEPSYSGINSELAEALDKFAVHEKFEFVLYRGSFRWMNMDGQVMSGHYESQSIQSIAEDFGYDVVYDAKHAAIFKHKGE